jgi:surfeit locus 1 family protein
MAAGYAFRIRWWALLAAASACAAGIALGNWQSRRADEKRQPFPRVSVAGEFVPRYTVYLDNKVRRGKAGYEIVTPLRLANTNSHVLVNRGWIEAGRTRDALPEVATPAGEVRIEGVALERFPKILVAGESRGRVRQTIDIDEFATETGLPLEPRVIEQHSDTPDGLSRDWPARDTGAEKHDAYALQWYALAALAVIIAVVLSFRKVEAPAK